MRPSPALAHRMRFTTKEVGRGFYRGSRTGAMGAHTEWGGYVIDYRRVRHYNIPDLTGFELTPFVSKAIDPKEKLPRNRDGSRYEPRRVDPIAYLKYWKVNNPQEYEFAANQERSDQLVNEFNSRGELNETEWEEYEMIVEKQYRTIERPRRTMADEVAMQKRLSEEQGEVRTLR